MSSTPRRPNYDHSTPHGPGRPLGNVRRTSSQPPQPVQPTSGTHRGTDTTGSAPWVNHLPSNSVGTAPSQVQAAHHPYLNNPQPSGDDWDFQMMLIDPIQSTGPHQQPEFYPSTTPTGQYVNPQSRDRQPSHQPSTPWTGDTRQQAQSLQSASSLPNPRTISSAQDVRYPTQPQSPQNYPQQRQQPHQPSTSRPGPQNNNQFSNQTSQPTSSSTQPQTVPPPQGVRYPTQPQYPQSRNGDPQNNPQQRQQQQPSTSPPGPPNNNQYSGQMSSSRPPAPPNASQRVFPPQPVVAPNKSQGGFSSQPEVLPNTPQRAFSSKPPVSPNLLQQAFSPQSLVSSNTSQVASLSRPTVPPNTSQKGASQYTTQPQYNSSSFSQHRRAHSPIRPTRTGEGERMRDEWGYQPGGTPSVPVAPQTAPQIAPQLPVVPNTRQPARPPQITTVPVPRGPSVPICRIQGCRKQVVKDHKTEELTEYCGEEHMSEALRLGVRVCPACNKFPRRTGREHCGLSCERWAAEQRQQQQRQVQQQQQQQQQRQIQPQQQRQVVPQQQRQSQQQSSAGNPHPEVPGVTWSNVATGRPTPSNSVSLPQPHVRRG